jgi:hypothetical protein
MASFEKIEPWKSRREAAEKQQAAAVTWGIRAQCWQIATRVLTLTETLRAGFMSHSRCVSYATKAASGSVSHDFSFIVPGLWASIRQLTVLHEFVAFRPPTGRVSGLQPYPLLSRVLL